MISFILSILIIPSLWFPTKTEASVIKEVPKLVPKTSSVKNIKTTPAIPQIPFYSQFTDIKSPQWQKVGCGVTSLAMVIDYYNSDTVSVNTLLKQGVDAGAYLKNAGWTYAGLISLGNKYGLSGKSFDLAKASEKNAFLEFKNQLKTGPVIVSVHYKFEPKNPIPHLVVVNGIKDDVIHYNDPAAKTGDKTISTTDFLKAWKKRFIVIRPEEKEKKIASVKK